jgi:alpha-methylacyl-CoA racemase
MAEAPHHPHIRARSTIVEAAGVPQPAPAPRFSATPAALDRPPPTPGQHTEEVLTACGFTSDELARLRAQGTVR